MTNKLKILHLEDLPSDAELVERVLRKGNIIFEKLVVDNKNDFTKALNEFSPDIILSDHSLPSFNSTEALKIVKASGLNIPFILITSTVSEEFAVSVLKMGVNDYILKDNMSRLPSAIEQVMEMYGDRRAKLRAEEELRATHERLLFHLENSPLGYIEWDDQLRPKTWSQKAEKIFGWTLKELNEKNMTGIDMLYKDGEYQHALEIANDITRGKLERVVREDRHITKDGRLIWCEWFNSVLKDKDGKVNTIMSLVQDITERKLSEVKLEKSEMRFREFFETAPEAVLVLDPESRAFVDYNDNALKLLKYSKEELLGKSPSDISPLLQPDGRRSIDKVIEMDKAALAGRLPVFDWILLDKEGKEIPVEIRLTLLTKTEKPLIRTSMVDITERINLQKELEEERITSQVEITDAVIVAQEQERSFLGQELHDNINQLLATSKLYLDFSISTEIIKKDKIQAGRDYILDAMEEIRRLSKRLIAPSLGEITLKEAVTDMIANFQPVHEMLFAHDWQNVDEKKIDEKLKLAIFRILQEQFNNILKYAHAKNVRIKMAQKNDTLELSIKDDGIGFDTTKKPKGVGLKNIASRASLFKGDVVIKSKPGKGCEILVKFREGITG